MNDSDIEGKGREGDVEFERQLAWSLRRVDVPEGFATRVLERAMTPQRSLQARPRFLHLPLSAWAGAIAAMLALTALLANQVQVHREQARVARIQAQFDTAMRVTSRALDQTRADLESQGLKLGE
jgi:hypothetical protein